MPTRAGNNWWDRWYDYFWGAGPQRIGPIGQPQLFRPPDRGDLPMESGPVNYDPVPGGGWRRRNPGFGNLSVNLPPPPTNLTPGPDVVLPGIGGSDDVGPGRRIGRNLGDLMSRKRLR